MEQPPFNFEVSQVEEALKLGPGERPFRGFLSVVLGVAGPIDFGDDSSGGAAEPLDADPVPHIDRIAQEIAEHLHVSFGKHGCCRALGSGSNARPAAAVGGTVWVDDQGVCHTIALPEPTELMSEIFLQSLNHLVSRGQEDVAEAMLNDQLRFYEERTKLLVPDTNEAEFVGLSPPIDRLAAPFEALAELRRLLYEIDDRWRLDALAAIEDFLS